MWQLFERIYLRRIDRGGECQQTGAGHDDTATDDHIDEPGRKR